MSTPRLWYNVLAAKYGVECGCIRRGISKASLWWKDLYGVQKGDEEFEGGWFKKDGSSCWQWKKFLILEQSLVRMRSFTFSVQ